MTGSFEWYHEKMPSLVFIWMLGFLHCFRARRRDESQTVFRMDSCSPGDRSFSMMFPEGECASSEASRSASSFLRHVGVARYPIRSGDCSARF